MAGAQDQAEYPIPFSERPYQDVHPSVKEAWYLVETGYVIVKDKYSQANQLLASDSLQDKEKGARLKDEVTNEIQTTIFDVNPTVNQLFKDAIDAEPDNPLNYASYAYYLKARRMISDTGEYLGEGEEEARKYIDQAIELWPDDAGFYLLKIHILSAPHQCHEWFRGSAGEEYVLANRLEELRELFSQAEKYDPENSYINYYHALLVVQLTPDFEINEVRDEVYRELVAGNNKQSGSFIFPPPLKPKVDSASLIRLTGNEQSAVYYDQWSFFGSFPEETVAKMEGFLLSGWNWESNRDEYEQLMLAIYKMGRVKPLTRSFFSLQYGVITQLQQAAEPGSQEALDFAAVARFLNQQYFDLTNDLLRKNVLRDATQLDVNGVAKAEKMAFRRKSDVDRFQKRQAAYLVRAGEILGLDFDLPEDRGEW